MTSRDRAAGSKGRSQGSGKTASAAKGIAATKKLAPVKKPAAKKATTLKKMPPPSKKVEAKKAAIVPPKPAPKPVPVPRSRRQGRHSAGAAGCAPAAAIAKPAAAPPRPATVAKAPGQDAASRLASAQQAEERRKAATRKLFARLRSLEAIVGADLRKRGSLLLSQAVDQWYAEAISATASDVTITNAARAVISQL